jgi:uncharacterized protein
MQLRVSSYNVTAPCPDGGHILYNQMSGAMLVLSDARLAEYEAGGWRAGDSGLRRALARGQFAVKEGVDERDAIREQWERVVGAPQMKALTIVPTDRCNLGCGYCYEEKADWDRMSDETIVLVRRFAERLVDATPTRQLAVTWFGGEPTLHMRCVEDLSRFFIGLCADRGIAYAPFMVTNGTTLTPRVIERLRGCAIRRVQVTVDGVQPDHDARRPFLRDVVAGNEAQRAQRAKIGLPILGQAPERPRSSFVEIMAAVRRLREAGFEVKLRMNVDRGNREGVRRLFRDLGAEGLLGRHPSGGVVLAYSSPIFEGCGGCSPTQMTRGEHAAFEAELRAEGLARDTWRFANLRFTGVTCTANMGYDFVINQRGNLSKCWHHATDNRHVIGTVADLGLAERGSRAVDALRFSPLDDPECRECPVLPVCMGGCKANNQFPERGYEGTHDMGCHAARYTMPEHVVALYEAKKAPHDAAV